MQEHAGQGYGVIPMGKGADTKTETKTAKIERSRLEDAVRTSHSYLSKSYADDILKKNGQHEQLRESMAVFLGTYKAVKTGLKEAELSGNTNYFDREALLDCYSAYIAANEALDYLAEEGIFKAVNLKNMFNRGLNLMIGETDPQMRDRLVIDEMVDIYLQFGEHISPKIVSDFTINYFEWIMLQAMKTKSSISQNSVFDEEMKGCKVILPHRGRQKQGKAKERMYDGFRTLEAKVCVGNGNGRAGNGSARGLMGGNGSNNSAAYDQGREQARERKFLIKDLPKVTFNDIGGLDNEKHLVYKAIRLPIEFSREYAEKGIMPPKGLIFYGEKGCGKTYLAKAIANEMKMAFFYVPGPSFRNKYVGAGADIVRQLFQDARELSPSIIFIDEVDACIERRETITGSYTSDIVDQMLIEIDGFNPLGNVKVIVSTNRYDALDGTFLDRFPPKYHLRFGLPDEKMRLKVLGSVTRGQKLKGIDLTAIAKETEGANCRALFYICNEAGVYSIEEHTQFIEQRHFSLSLGDYHANPASFKEKRDLDPATGHYVAKLAVRGR